MADSPAPFYMMIVVISITVADCKSHYIEHFIHFVHAFCLSLRQPARPTAHSINTTDPLKQRRGISLGWTGLRNIHPFKACKYLSTSFFGSITYPLSGEVREAPSRCELANHFLHTRFAVWPRHWLPTVTRIVAATCTRMGGLRE